jgi:thioesterase domain-containing protein
VILGGNCQGGIIALALAKQLKQIGKAPATLVLMEWSYSFGMYTEPVHFLYGKQSFTAEIYTKPEKAKVNWQHDFPNHMVTTIPGAHGNYFEEPNIQSLAAVLSKTSTVKIIWNSVIRQVNKIRM